MKVTQNCDQSNDSNVVHGVQTKLMIGAHHEIKNQSAYEYWSLAWEVTMSDC